MCNEEKSEIKEFYDALKNFKKYNDKILEDLNKTATILFSGLKTGVLNSELEKLSKCYNQIKETINIPIETLINEINLLDHSILTPEILECANKINLSNINSDLKVSNYSKNSVNFKKNLIDNIMNSPTSMIIQKLNNIEIKLDKILDISQ